MVGAWSVACLCLAQAVSPSVQGVPSELREAEVRAVEVDSRGAVWVSVSGTGLGRVVGDEVDWISSAELPDGVADIAEDREGLWAVGLGGVSRGGAEGWAAIETPTRPRVVFSVEVGSLPGQLWFGTSSGALNLTDEGWSAVSDGLPHPVVHQVLVDRTAAVWFLCRRGVARLENGALEIFRPDLNFRTGIVTESGEPWFGTSGGLLRWTGSGFVTELEGTTPYPRLTASDGSIWAGSASDGVLRFTAGEWTRPLPELSGYEVFDVAEGPDGEIWIASAVGLRRVELAGL